MRNRSVIEIIVLTMTFVVAFSIIATGALVAIIEIRDPTADTAEITAVLGAAINIILGALLGLFIKNSSTGSALDRVPGTDWQRQTDDLYRRPDPGNIVPTWNHGEAEDGDQ